MCEEINHVVLFMGCRMFDFINLVVHHKGRFNKDDMTHWNMWTVSSVFGRIMKDDSVDYF